MIPYGRQFITQSDIDSVVEVLRSDWLTQGPIVPKFERSVADFVGALHGVATNSATSSLHIACMALGVGKGDLVWTSPNTFVASANCALYCGAEVDFVEIDPHTYNLSIDCLSKKLQEAKTKNRLPKVVIPVHFSGQPCDMAAIYALSQEFGFSIIEDASHAIGASYCHNAVGACVYSDITVFSFHPVKIITTGEGGMALTNSPELAERMTRYRSHGITSQPDRMHTRPLDEIWNYQQIDLGFNYRMTDIQAALGLSQLERLDSIVERRHEIASRYNSALSDISVITPLQDPRSRSSYHLYVIRVRETLCGRTQRQVYDNLWSAGIGVNLHYIPVYRQPYYESLGFTSGYCPEAELFHKEAISLPIYPTLSDEQQDAVIGALRDSVQ